VENGRRKPLARSLSTKPESSSATGNARMRMIKNLGTIIVGEPYPEDIT